MGQDKETWRDNEDEDNRPPTLSSQNSVLSSKMNTLKLSNLSERNSACENSDEQDCSAAGSSTPPLSVFQMIPNNNVVGEEQMNETKDDVGTKNTHHTNQSFSLISKVLQDNLMTVSSSSEILSSDCNHCVTGSLSVNEDHYLPKSVPVDSDVHGKINNVNLPPNDCKPQSRNIIHENNSTSLSHSSHQNSDGKSITPKLALLTLQTLKQTGVRVGIGTVAGGIAGGFVAFCFLGPAGAYYGINIGRTCGAIGALVNTVSYCCSLDLLRTITYISG